VNEDIQSRIVEFLASQHGVDWCDACLAAKFDTTVPRIAEGSQTLSKTGVYVRDRWRCSQCGVRGDVTRGHTNRRLTSTARPSAMATTTPKQTKAS
jgi:hypothetical protein